MAYGIGGDLMAYLDEGMYIGGGGVVLKEPD